MVYLDLYMHAWFGPMVHAYIHTYIHTYYHHAELLDTPYTIMLFWFNLLLTETHILTKLTPARQY